MSAMDLVFNWIQMNVATQRRKAGISLYQNRFVSALVEMTNSVVPSIEPNGLGHIEIAHQFGDISQAGL
jgi:hypothetical protein